MRRAGEAARDRSADGRKEDFASRADAGEAEQELARRRRLWRTRAPAVRVTTALLLGLRKLRAVYALQVTTWRELNELSSPASPAEERGAGGRCKCQATTGCARRRMDGDSCRKGGSGLNAVARAASRGRCRSVAR